MTPVDSMSPRDQLGPSLLPAPPAPVGGRLPRVPAVGLAGPPTPHYPHMFQPARAPHTVRCSLLRCLHPPIKVGVGTPPPSSQRTQLSVACAFSNNPADPAPSMSKQLATTGGDLTPPPLSYGDPGLRHVTAHLLALLYIELRDMFEWVPTDEIFKAIARSSTTDYQVSRDLAIAHLKSLPPARLLVTPRRAASHHQDAPAGTGLKLLAAIETRMATAASSGRITAQEVIKLGSSDSKDVDPSYRPAGAIKVIEKGKGRATTPPPTSKKGPPDYYSKAPGGSGLTHAERDAIPGAPVAPAAPVAFEPGPFERVRTPYHGTGAGKKEDTRAKGKKEYTGAKAKK
ncbi:uncharacterized protein EV422DRAFT_611379 [Fimicolochytrium jonesii]|uniref:uncharacterized protein n=1 Tax=Fimicolochytrium jonesii TaxID=1396493 RepID=UPI0022FEAE6B|nr:uncharacterized protein EV422DRAFT_611379 [Fimicolochytrium jonesii]KAI8823356.1 hypothetical protein EV422DRAFT_611379 [Fimicolochytrium jonesii]